jgi:hypothetical protein
MEICKVEKDVSARCGGGYDQEKSKKRKEREGDQGGRELNEMLARVECRRSRLYSSSRPCPLQLPLNPHISQDPDAVYPISHPRKPAQ